MTYEFELCDCLELIFGTRPAGSETGDSTTPVLVDPMRDRNQSSLIVGQNTRMPHMDDGPTDGRPGNLLASVWVNLTPDEAIELLHALLDWAESVDDGEADPGWHTHITDTEGRELTVAVAEDERLHEHHE